jgi:sugar phosphate permease
MAARVRGRLFYGWLIVGVTFLTMLAASGVRAVPSVLILPLEHDFGWSRSVVALAVSINLFLFGLCGPFAAAVMERIGMRAMMLAALGVMGLAVILTTQIHAAWQLQLLWGVIVGLGAGALSGWVAATVANRWFVTRRGLVVGVLTAAGATGQLIFLPILASAIEAVGWRVAVLIVAAAALALVPLVAFVIRDSPQQLGLQPYGAQESDTPAAPLAPTSGNPFAAAIQTLIQGLRSRDFRLLAGTFFICGASTNGLIGTHLIPNSVEHGMTEVTAAGLLAVIGAFDIVGTIASGWLSDRFDNRWLLAWYYSLRGLALLFLPYAYGSGYFGIALFVVFYGLDWVATVPPTVRLTADIFGRQNAGRMMAWIFVAHQLGAAAVAYAAGAMHDWFGDYRGAFLTSGFICLIAASMAIRIGRSARPAPRPAAPPALAGTTGD